MRILLCLVLCIVRLYVGYCGILEFSDLSDNLPFIWSNKISVTSAQQTKCTLQSSGDGIVTEGICKTRTQCLLSGGVASGRCGLLSTCCTYGRARSTNAKVSYFSSSEVLFTGSPISFNVIRMNENVCQLRLDFLEFNLSPATPVQITTTPQPTNYQCVTDNFYVIPGPQIPQICGFNSGQHIYVNMPNTLHNLSLNVKYTSRASELPRWNIKVTQLQCPRVLDKRVLIDHAIAEDFSMIAPPGCLQYFNKETGSIRSFGFEETTANFYVANQFYSICFKRSEYTCGVSFSVRQARIYDTGTACNDFIMVPGLEMNNAVVTSNKICSSMTNFNIISRTPGPLHIDFRAAPSTVGAVGGGFIMDYTLVPCSY